MLLKKDFGLNFSDEHLLLHELNNYQIFFDIYSKNLSLEQVHSVHKFYCLFYLPQNIHLFLFFLLHYFVVYNILFYLLPKVYKKQKIHLEYLEYIEVFRILKYFFVENKALLLKEIRRIHMIYIFLIRMEIDILLRNVN